MTDRASQIFAIAQDMVAVRRDLHAHPELMFDVHRTAGVVAKLLSDFGCNRVETGIGRTGVVGVIEGRGPSSRKAIGLRADMDALPILEATGLPYASVNAGRMHACGHDGHTAMLLGAARYLCETRAFSGTAVVIFQPAEEGGGGGKAMIADGLMDRFAVEEVYGLHNMPGLPPGHFAIRAGPMMAAADQFSIHLEGQGGHAAKPHGCHDPVLAASHIVTALQSIVSRGVDPLNAAVVSVTSIQAGEAFNVIPQSARIIGTCRSLTPEVRLFLEERLTHIARLTAEALGVKASVSYRRGYPVTFNHAAQTGFAAEAAQAVAGTSHVDTSPAPSMGAEDFSYMLEARPGAYIFMGNGDSAGLHHPAYNFNDETLPTGITYWSTLAEQRLEAE